MGDYSAPLIQIFPMPLVVDRSVGYPPRFNNWLMVTVRLSSYGCKRVVAEHERGVRIAL